MANMNQQQRVLQATVPALYLQYLPARYAKRAKDFFAYGIDFTPLAAGGTDSDTFSVQQDSDFLLVGLTARVNEDGSPNTPTDDPGITIQIRDTGSGRSLFGRSLALRTIVGTGELPTYLPWPKFINRGSVVTAELNNLVAGTAFDVRLSFLGFKIFMSEQGV